ncbi:hypothetical protein BSL78_16749 [Apostichopus japonicus]|uniref:Uncharacterized protein n=1 Tax=Stichopus japonicus TaxID=307972 RepID=A0A2G8KEE0_STIJA|nr:hypothetical protein BSL78_16749 [Apostichopus japonicus]
MHLFLYAGTWWVCRSDYREDESIHAQLFNLKPWVKREAKRPAAAINGNTPLSTREKSDRLIETFGSNKQKRAMHSRLKTRFRKILSIRQPPLQLRMQKNCLLNLMLSDSRVSLEVNSLPALKSSF